MLNRDNLLGGWREIGARDCFGHAEQLPTDGGCVKVIVAIRRLVPNA
jgi:hypothetical protein